jgi:hypothetical protein
VLAVLTANKKRGFGKPILFFYQPGTTPQNKAPQDPSRKKRPQTTLSGGVFFGFTSPYRPVLSGWTVPFPYQNTGPYPDGGPDSPYHLP